SAEQSSTSSVASPEKPRGSASGELLDLRLERLLWGHGVCRIAGVDEAGRGAWAGPVVAAAVVLPSDEGLIANLLSPAPLAEHSSFVGVRDSKQLTAAQRTAAEQVIREVAIDIGVGIVPPSVVDEAGLAFAGQLAFWRAVCGLTNPPEHVL